MTDSATSEQLHDLAAVLRAHPAVADATVVPGAADRTPDVWLVPDPDAAALLHRSAVLEAAGRLDALGWHEPCDELRVAGLNRSETEFLYREIFTENAYVRHGITLPPGAVVVDAGANIGMFTLYVALHSPGARVIAVEPMAELADAVAVNAELYGADVTVLRCGLGRAEAAAEFTYYPNNSVMSGGLADAEEDLAVLRGYLLTGDGAEPGAQLDRLAADRMTAQRRHLPVTTLTKVAAEHELTRIDLLKIDVEKAEAEVLEGIGDTLWPRIDQIVMEVHDVNGRLAAILATLRAKGFTVTHEQDARLALTPCHSVYAYRPQATAQAPVADTPGPADRGPTLQVLERELRELIAQHAPLDTPPRRFGVVSDLDQVVARSAAPATRPVLADTARTAILAEIWSGLFGPEAVRQDADFFDLGGDSLTAVRLLAQIEQRLGEEALAPDLIFTDSTFGALAAAIEATAPSGTAAGDDEHRPVVNADHSP
ncbi:FkbM family methyltransferase [Streptomyces sp. TRM68367]|uniref:FkbM family methyltransferase n=1 Tax=Streptomyces sp. TRM68367 TaxID=2758415 RepID=UPI00165AEE9D|nr:FkbM family methyltransferase [Streptomyces sp. TRM68367]MBC9726551.1 FkbM family methyltransferase [Streptomyces sp. TRM68367]